MNPGSRAERGLFAALALIVAVPLLLGGYLPFLDLPQHLGLATIIHHLGDPGWDFDATYLLDHRPLPYWGFYGPVHLLAHGMSVPAAARLVLFLSALALPYGARALFSAFGRDPRLGLLALPLCWNTNLYMGFVSFVVAVPLFLFAVASVETLFAAERPSWGLRLRALLLSLAVYFGHGQVFLLFLCALGVLFLLHTFGRRGEGRGRWRRLWVFAPALGFGTYWIGTVVLAPASEVGAAEHLAVFGSLGVLGKVSFDPVSKNLAELGRYLWDVSPGHLDELVFYTLFGLLGAGAVHRLVTFLLSLRRGGGFPGLFDLRLELLAAGLLLSYFVSPMEIGMQWYVHPRHLLFAALLAPATLSPRLLAPAEPGGRADRFLAPAVIGVASLLALGATAQATLTLRAFQQEARGFDEVLAAATPGGRTLGLIFDNGGGGAVRVWPFLHFAGYLQAKGGGDLGFSFAGLPSLPVRYRPGAQAPHPYEWRPHTFRIATHGRHYDRYLIRGRPTGDALRLSRSVPKVVRSGAWTLIETPRRKNEGGSDSPGTSGPPGRP